MLNNIRLDGNIMIELKLLTEKLKRELDWLEGKYRSSDRNQVEGSRDFFEYVKQDSQSLFELIGRWYQLTLQFSENNKMAIYEHQIEATKENFEMLIL